MKNINKIKWGGVMPTVIIVKPNDTKEEERNNINNIERVVEKMILKEFGIKTKVTIKDTSE